MPNTPDEIIEIVDAMETDRSALHAVMDYDVDLYNQVPYEDDDGRLDGYAHFTSSNPTTYMDLALHMGSTANRIIRVKEPRETEEAAETNNLSELFALGALKSADELRANLLMPDVQSAGFAMSCFRGRVCYRVLLRKEEIESADFQLPSGETGGLFDANGGVLLPSMSRTRTYVEIMDWDPRNVYFELGKNGLEWACEKSWKSRQQIITEYGVDPADDGEPFANSDDREYAIYDYLDRENNTVIVETKKVLKRKEAHWMARVPVAFAFADNRPYFPQFINNEHDKGNSAEYGRGFFHADRKIFPEMNFMHSINKELAHRSIKPGMKVFSRDGSFTLDEGDPHETGQAYPLNTSNEENFEPVAQYELTPTAAQWTGTLSGMEQRGAFPLTEFGALSSPLSGIAIAELRLNRLAPMTVHINAVQSALKQCLDILRGAYVTGRFDTMVMSGDMQDPNKTFFSRPISPDMVRGGGIYEVELVAQLPRDDAATAALVSQIKQSGLPVDDKTLLEMMEFQDPQQLIRAWWEQTAGQSHPLAMAFNSAKAAFEQGNEQIAEVWNAEYFIQQMTQRIQLLQSLMMGSLMGGGGGQAPAQNGNGASPARRPRLPSADVISPEMMGIQHQPNQVAASMGAASNAGQPRVTRQRPPYPDFGLLG